MNLKNYTWNNGTKNSPIVLNNSQIKKLLAIGQTKNVNTTVKGWITTSSRKMQKFLKYSLEQAFPELNIICDEALEDLFTIKAANSVIKEGTKEQIIINSDTGVTSSFLKWKYEYSDFLIDGDLSEQNIKDKIRVKNGYLEVDAPKENASWSVTLKLTAYPSYYKDSEFNSIPAAAKPYLIFVIMAKKLEDVVVNIEDDIPVNASISANVKPIPEDSTKLAGAFYTYSTTTPELINISTTGLETEVIAKNKGFANLTVTVHACNNTITKTNTISFVIYDSIRPMTFFIDQRGGISDPDTMVSKNYIRKTNGDLIELSDNGALGDPDSNVLTWLRKNSHAYVGKYENNIMKLKQLDDTNRKLFADGSSSEGYIDNEEYNVWMKINSDIYYKSEASIPPGSDEINENYVAITIARELPAGEDETMWQRWDKNHLIGVYLSCKKHEALYSISGQRPINNLDGASLLRLSKNQGISYSVCTYSVYKLLFILFAGYYSTLNTKNILGIGTNNTYDSIVYPKITGSTDYLANKDSNTITGTGSSNPNSNQIIAGEGEDIKTTNFWNIESLYDDLGEVIDGIVSFRESFYNNYKDNYPILIENGKIVESFNSIKGMCVGVIHEQGNYLISTNLWYDHGYSFKFIKTITFGKFCDFIIKNNTDTATTTDIYFSCANDNRNNDIGYLFFGYGSNSTYNGIASISSQNSINYPIIATRGSRLMFKGTNNSISIVDDFTENS